MIRWIIYATFRFVLYFKSTKLNALSAWPEQEDFMYKYYNGYPNRSYKTPLHYIFNISHTKTAEREHKEREKIRAVEYNKWKKGEPNNF